MSNQPKPTCAECAFAKTIRVKRHAKDPISDRFHCYRFPPTIVPATATARAYHRPLVDACDWCGEFTPSEPQEVAISTEWRELNQFDPEASLTLSALPVEAEFKDLTEGGAWHPVHDHIFEMEESCNGNVCEHIKAGLRVRVPLPALSKQALDLYRVIVKEAESKEGFKNRVANERENAVHLKLCRELADAGLLHCVETSTAGKPDTFLFTLPTV